MDGYKEAEKIDGKLNKLIGEHGISKDNCADWLTMVRTVESGLLLIQEKAQRVMQEENRLLKEFIDEG